MMLLLFACQDATDTGGKPADSDSGEVTACSTDDACMPYGVCEAGECVDGDRNNDVDEAETLLWEEASTGLLNPAGDVDYYTFSAEGGEFVRVKTVLDDPDSDTHDTVVTLRDPNGKTVAFSDGYPTGGSISNADAVIYAYLSAAGAYTIAVQDAADYYDDAGNGDRDYGYSVLVEEWNQHTSEDDASFDLSLDSANSWSAVGVIIGEEDDTDKITVELAWGEAALTIAGAIDLGNSESTPVVELSDDGTLLSSKENFGPAGIAAYPSIDAKTYTLTLSDSAGYGDDHWFFVFVKVAEEDSAYPEELEDNGTRGTAMALDFSEKTTSEDKPYSYAHIWGDADGGGDDDWYVIDAPYDENYVVACAQGPTYGAGAPLTLTVYDADGNELGSNDEFADGPDARVENAELGAPGTLRIQAGGSGMDDWYEAIVYVASFSVDSYEEGGYSCP